MSPFNSFLFMQGIESLAVRMDRHCENAFRVGEFLRDHSQVRRVNYAGLDDHEDKPLVDKYMGKKRQVSSVLTLKVGAKREPDS